MCEIEQMLDIEDNPWNTLQRRKRNNIIECLHCAIQTVVLLKSSQQPWKEHIIFSNFQ